MATTGAGVFRCPSCNEFIATEASECRFCGVPVNAGEAKRLTLKQTELDNAIGGARTIKVTVSSMLVAIPLTTALGLLYPTVLTVIAEVMAIQWLARFSKVQTPEVRRLRLHVSLLAFLAIAVFVTSMFLAYRIFAN